MIKYFITSYKIYIYKGVRYDMSQIKSDVSQTSSILLLYKVLSVNVTVLEPTKDESTTVKGNSNAHNAIDDLIKMNQSVAEVIEKASQNIQNVGESFEQTDQSISNDIAKN